MTTYLLDTTVLIDVLNRKRNREALLGSLLDEGNLLACCAINITEVYAGMRAQEQERTARLLDSLEYYAITREEARLAGLLKNEWAQQGVTLSVTDVTIAAVAIANRLTLITDNVKDYPMPELKLYRFG